MNIYRDRYKSFGVILSYTLTEFNEAMVFELEPSPKIGT